MNYKYDELTNLLHCDMLLGPDPKMEDMGFSPKGLEHGSGVVLIKGIHAIAIHEEHEDHTIIFLPSGLQVGVRVPIHEVLNFWTSTL